MRIHTYPTAILVCAPTSHNSLPLAQSYVMAPKALAAQRAMARKAAAKARVRLGKATKTAATPKAKAQAKDKAKI